MPIPNPILTTRLRTCALDGVLAASLQQIGCRGAMRCSSEMERGSLAAVRCGALPPWRLHHHRERPGSLPPAVRPGPLRSGLHDCGSHARLPCGRSGLPVPLRFLVRRARRHRVAPRRRKRPWAYAARPGKRWVNHFAPGVFVCRASASDRALRRLSGCAGLACTSFRRESLSFNGSHGCIRTASRACGYAPAPKSSSAMRAVSAASLA